MEFFILKQKRTGLIKDYLTIEEKAELLDAIIDCMNGEDTNFKSDVANILFEILISDHDEMVNDFFGDFSGK